MPGSTMRNRTTGGKRGASLLIVLVLITALALLTSSIIPQCIAETRAARDAVDLALALQVAEAGAHYEIEWLVQRQPQHVWLDSDATSGLTREYPPGSGHSFRVGVSESHTEREKTLIAEGRVRGLRRRIQMKVLLPADGNIWSFAVLTRESLGLSGSATIGSSPRKGEGNVHSNGDVSLSGAVSVDGKVSATGQVSKGGKVTGPRSSGAGSIPFPEVDLQRLKERASAFGTVGSVTPGVPLQGIHHGTLTSTGIGSLTIDGILWVTGNLHLTGLQITGDGVLVVEGDIHLSGGSSITTGPSTTTFIGLGNMTVTGHAEVRAGLYLPNGTLTIAGTADILGTVAANRLSITGNATINRDTDFSPPAVLGGDPLLLDWREL